MQYKDYYKTLGIERTATEAEIKSAYRKLTKKFHPDVNKAKDAQEKFKDINEAYEVLSDKEKRSRYDSLGANWQSGSDFTPPPGFDGFNFNQGQGGFHSGQSYASFDDLGGFSDFFRAIFGDFSGAAQGPQRSQRRKTQSRQNFYDDLGGIYGQQPRQRQKPSQNLDITQDLKITAKDIFAQKPINVKITNLEECKKCKGPGSMCYECGGSGVVSKAKTLHVKLPEEVKEGQKIRLKGEGKSDEYGQKGDLYLSIKYQDKEYSIHGQDLTKNVEISPSEAVLGAKKEIATLHGNVTIKIPEKTENAKVLRLANLGLPKKTGGYGNLNVKININIPKNLSEKMVDLYKQLAELEN